MNQRAAIYSRHGTRQLPVAAPDDQLHMCRALAERQGWEVIATYVDEPHGGSNGRRAGYRRLLADAQAGKFDVVIATSMDRLNRDLEEMSQLYRCLTRVGVVIHTVAEGQIAEAA